MFLGRIVGETTAEYPNGSPEWLPEDSTAALEWQAWKASLCSGCGHPRHESFAIENSFRYTATEMECHACAARDRRAYSRNRRDAGASPNFGEYYSVALDPD